MMKRKEKGGEATGRGKDFDFEAQGAQGGNVEPRGGQRGNIRVNIEKMPSGGPGSFEVPKGLQGRRKKS